MGELISILVPVYNVEKYLSRCLDSIINQTYRNLEIICVDDGSTDKSGVILDEYAKKDSRIVIIHKENGGAVSARKAAIKIATGEYIGAVDSDDYIELNMYEDMLNILIKHDVDMVSSGMIVENNDSAINVEIGIEGVYLRYAEGDKCSCNHMFMFDKKSTMKIEDPCWNKLYKKYIWVNYYMKIPDDIVYGEDSAFTYSYMPYVDSIYIDNRYYYHYNKTNETAITAKAGQDIEYINDIFKVHIYLSNAYKGHEKESELSEQLFMYITKMQFLLFPKNINIDRYLSTVSFSTIEQRKSIFIYGAGVIGKSYYKELMLKDKVDIKGIVDKNKVGEKLCDITVSSLEVLKDYDKYDYILIAIFDEELANSIKEDLIKCYGIDKHKIIWDKTTDIVTYVIETLFPY